MGSEGDGLGESGEDLTGQTDDSVVEVHGGDAAVEEERDHCRPVPNRGGMDVGVKFHGGEDFIDLWLGQASSDASREERGEQPGAFARQGAVADGHHDGVTECFELVADRLEPVQLGRP